ncbi:porin [Chitinibacter tainanensis]|uniref:porin n=1 Tax=Chitinibacter tainanensis TaxID=230667 RepID=UPI00041D4C20|nr:porin [Chitinibacter tainanensis]
MMKLIAAAVAAAFVAPAAFADVDLGPVKIYGSLRTAVEIASVSPLAGTTVTDANDDQTRLADQGSRFGVKGEWKLNDNLKAIGQVESRIYVGDSGEKKSATATFGTRNTFIGLESTAAGKFLAGRYDNAYKNLKKAAYGVFDDNLNDTTDLTGKDSIIGRMGGREGDIVHYETPKFAGFSGQLSYNFGKVGEVNAPQLSLMAAYSSQFFDLGVGYAKLSDASYDLTGVKLSSKSDVTGKQSNESADAVTVGGTLKYAGVKFSAVWEKMNTEYAIGSAAKTEQEQNTYGFGLGYAMGDWNFHANYAIADEVEQNGKTVADSGAKQFGLGASYNLHKQVRVIATYTKIDNDKNANSTTGSGFSLSKGSDASIFAIGLRGDF